MKTMWLEKLNVLQLTMLILCVGMLSSTLSPVSAQPQERFKVLLGFHSQPGPAEEALVRAQGGQIKYTYHLIPAIAATVPLQAVEGLRQNPNVAVVEPDAEVHLVDTELKNTWGVKAIGAGLVHDSGNKGGGVKVAVLDTGIDTDHPDLRYDPTCSFNFVDGNNIPEDGHGHGTHVAGTIAALDDDVGVVGVAPEATLCIYKVLNDAGSGNYSDIIAALERAVTDGVRITNNSYADADESQTYASDGRSGKAAFANAYASGMLHVAAAGNSGNRFGTGENCVFPARWGSVIATAATTKRNTRAVFSSTCPELELAAPGYLIRSTVPGGGYGDKSGTSMASPHVAGVAALIWAAHPEWSRDDVRAQLLSNALDLGDPGCDTQYGCGLVQAAWLAGGSDGGSGGGGKGGGSGGGGKKPR